MSDLLSIGTSALLAYRRALDTTGHNIANVNTAGYSRQRLELSARPGTQSDGGYIGSGVSSNTVRRMSDSLTYTRLLGDTSAAARLQGLSTIATRVDTLLSNSSSGLGSALQEFFAAAEDLGANPSSTAVRQSLLSAGQGLAARFQSLQTQLDSAGSDINGGIEQAVTDINNYASAIAKLNERIVLAQSASGGQPPNDLLDQRDQLVGELSSLVGINTSAQADGSLNVFVGSGQTLVLGKQAGQLATTPDAFNSGRLEIAYLSGGSSSQITGQLGGGTLGGLLDARREVLEPAQTQLGRVAVALSLGINAQNAQGTDQNGNAGGAIFSPPAGSVLAATANTGNAGVALAFGDTNALSGEDYQLRYDGSGWQMTSAATGASIALSGSGSVDDPLVGSGIRLTISGTPQAGDRYLLQPTSKAAGRLQVTLSDPAGIAAAGAVQSSAATANSGSGSIAAASVVDATNPSLRSAATIRFTSATTYSIDGSGSYPYSAGADIVHNGWRVQISGAPAAGDEFAVAATPAASSDNRNASLLAGLADAGLLDGGRSTLSAANGALVAKAGAQARQTQASLSAQTAVLAQTEAERDAVSGVNLDEEAADLVRFQQAYQAAAQVIATANTVFQSLLDATRR